MVTNSLLYYFSVLLLIYQSAFGVELTFDLPDSARDCFHEDIEKNTSVILEYQVIDKIIPIIFDVEFLCTRPGLC